jgi:ubiquinone/menaquinone biosynthesis C-methylase UbiE
MTEHGEVLSEPDVLPVLQSKEETRAFYNKIAKVYDLLAERSEQPVRDTGFAKLNPQPGECVLEIGFGTGHNLLRIAKQVGPTGKVFGIDLAEKMVESAQQLVDKEGLHERVDLTCGDAEQLPYEPETMDAVVMNFTLELFNTPDVPLVLEQCRQVLRHGGRIVVAGISKEGKQGVTIRAFEWTHRHFPNLMDCRPIYVRRAVETAGFHIEDTSLEHIWVPIEIILGKKP